MLPGDPGLSTARDTAIHLRRLVIFTLFLHLSTLMTECVLSLFKAFLFFLVYTVSNRNYVGLLVTQTKKITEALKSAFLSHIKEVWSEAVQG